MENKRQIDLNAIGKLFYKELPNVGFAYIFGSAQNGVVSSKSDVDVAFYFKDKKFANYEELSKIYEIFGQMYPDLELDICVLNTDSVILAFEVLSGKRLFVRNSFIDKYCRIFFLNL